MAPRTVAASAERRPRRARRPTATAASHAVASGPHEVAIDPAHHVRVPRVAAPSAGHPRERHGGSIGRRPTRGRTAATPVGAQELAVSTVHRNDAARDASRPSSSRSPSSCCAAGCRRCARRSTSRTAPRSPRAARRSRPRRSSRSPTTCLPLTSLAAWKDRAAAVQHAGASVRASRPAARRHVGAHRHARRGGACAC